MKGEKLIMLEADTIRNLLSERFSFTDPTEERYELSNLIATFLLSSIFGSRLQISSDGKTIIKGFRYGENSDLALPFLNLVFYWAVVLMVDQIGKKSFVTAMTSSQVV